MKNIKDYILENRDSDPNWVVSSFPIGQMKAEIDAAYGSNVKITVEEDIILFEDEDNQIFFSIERIPKKIVCPEGMEEFLKDKFNFNDNDFLK